MNAFYISRLTMKTPVALGTVKGNVYQTVMLIRKIFLDTTFKSTDPEFSLYKFCVVEGKTYTYLLLALLTT
jgi:hypothetical protein